MSITYAGESMVRVVLVEDHELIRSAVRQALTGPGIEVVGEAGNAEDAGSSSRVCLGPRSSC
jgi:chemotaxis response regulator CheB